MDRSYYARPSSPGGRRIANPERASAHQLGNHDHYYGGPRASREYIDPRSSGERVIVPHTHQYSPHAPPSSTSSRSTANFSAYSGRPRRSTLESNSTRPSSVSHSSRNRPAVIHAAHDNRPSSPLAYEDGHRGREHAYPPPPPTSAPKVPHKKVYSVDDGRSRLIEEADIVPRRERRSSVERNNHKSTHIGGSRQSYYPNVPVVAPRDTEQYYSYTDPAKMYTETEPSWRPRGSSVERKPRPSSVIIEPSVGAAAPKSAREYGPPVSTRGFDRIHGNTGLGRSGSLRDNHHRTSSRERDRQNAYTQVSRENTLDPYVHSQDLPLRSNSALSAPRPQHDARPVDAYRDQTYDEPRSGRNHQRRSTYEDPDVAARGFGIRSGSHDRHGRDTSIDRHAPHAPAPPPDSVTIPDPRSYIPDMIVQPIPPPPPRDGRDGRREYDRVERDWAPTVDRERDREHRDRPREHKERDYEKERDRPRERERDRDRDDRDKHRDRDDRDRYYERDERARRDKDRDDRDGRDARDYLPAAAIAGGAAAAAGAYGLHKTEKDDRREDSRRYEDETRRAPADDRRAVTIPVPADYRPPPPPEDRRPPPQTNLDYYPPPPPPPQDSRGVPSLDSRRAPPIPPPGSQAPVDDRRSPQTEHRGAPDDRGAVAPERPQAKQQSSDTEVPVRQRHYVDRDAERDAGGRQDSKRTEAVDADEDYRRRLQAAQADLQRSNSAAPALAQRSAVRDSRREAPGDRDSSGSDRERRRRDRGYGNEHDRLNVERAPAVPTPIPAPPPGPPGAYPADVPPPPRSERSERSDRSHRDRDAPSRAPPQSDQPRDLNSTVLGQHFVQDPEEYDEPERDRKVSIVAPPIESPPPVRGILRKPTEKFPEDPNPIREGVAPMKDAKKGKDIPVNARWTKIDRRLVNPDALKEAKERFEERMDCVIVLRVLSKEDIQKLADRTRELRERREDDEGDDRYRDDRERDTGRDDQERDRDREHRRRRHRERRQGDEADDTEGSEYDTDREWRREKARPAEAVPDEERSREYVR